MKVRWQGGPRAVFRIGTPTDGEVYDWPDDVALSLIEQGKAFAVPNAPVSTPKLKILDAELITPTSKAKE